ncbi:hypothetical protein [Polymorphospora sp. NPDC050346]|uniref:hypothetical protein n=1 Tax=Polymorphospora sp. NPDC050346 TaxID=3155780 RepID=UPI0033E0401C
MVVGFYRVCVIDAVLEHSPADYVRRPTVPVESPTLGLGHLQFEAPITPARKSPNPNHFALVALLGLLGLRIFEACESSIADLGEEHGHRVLRVRGKGGMVVLVPLPPAVARAIDRAVDERTSGPILSYPVAIAPPCRDPRAGHGRDHRREDVSGLGPTKRAQSQSLTPRAIITLGDIYARTSTFFRRHSYQSAKPGTVSGTAPLCVKALASERSPTCWIGGGDQGLQP